MVKETDGKVEIDPESLIARSELKKKKLTALTSQKRHFCQIIFESLQYEVSMALHFKVPQRTESDIGSVGDDYSITDYPRRISLWG